jgi:hypothetical protein
LSFQVAITVNYRVNQITGYNTPQIRLSEVTAIHKRQTGHDEVIYGKTWFLSLDELDRVIKSGGNFDRIGIILTTNQPVARIGDIWWGI